MAADLETVADAVPDQPAAGDAAAGTTAPVGDALRDSTVEDRLAGADEGVPEPVMTGTARRRRRWPWVVAVVVLFALFATTGAFAGATVSYADANEGLLLPGTTINGVDVSGMTQDQAIRAVRRSLRADLNREVTVVYEGRRWSSSARDLGVRSDVREVVQRVAASQRDVTWRQWVGLRWFGERSSSEADVTLRYPQRPVTQFVAGIADEINSKPRDAELDVSGSDITITPHAPGWEVSERAVRRDIRAVVRGNDDGPVTLSVERLPAEVKTKKFDQVLLLDQSDHTLTLFLDGEATNSWTVAVGTGDYPTPVGRYEVSLKRYMPTWVNPDPDGWGANMPEVIPPGENNPLGLRALNWSAPGAIRFHGTQAVDTLGTDASHGCVRMSNSDVVQLYDMVDEGAVIVSQI